MGTGWLTMFFFYMGVGVMCFTLLYVLWKIAVELWFYLVVVPIAWIRNLLSRSALL